MQNRGTHIAPVSEPRFLSLGPLVFSAERLRTIPKPPFNKMLTSFCGTDFAQAIEFGNILDAPNSMIVPAYFHPERVPYIIIDPEIIAYLVKYRKDHHDGSDKKNNYLIEDMKRLLMRYDRTPEENDAIMKRIVLNFINYIEPVSIEDETFEVNYWIEYETIEDETFEGKHWWKGEPYKSHMFSMHEPKLRRSVFYPLSKDQLIDLADVCLNADSPFDDASKEEIRAAFVDKGILSNRIKNARSGNVKNSDRITEPFLEEKDTINNDVAESWVKEPFLEEKDTINNDVAESWVKEPFLEEKDTINNDVAESWVKEPFLEEKDDINNDVAESWVKEPFLEEKDTISNDVTHNQIIEMPRVEYTKSKKTVIISGTKDVIERAIRNEKIDLTQIENIIFKSPDMTEIPGLLSRMNMLRSLNI